MTNTSAYIHCMLIPLEQHYLLLPNTTIAEVIPRIRIDSSAMMSQYHLGRLTWRDHSLPLIDLEGLIEKQTLNPDQSQKLCILRGINTEAKINFYAIPCFGTPQLITLNDTALQPTHDANDSEFLHCQIKIGNKVAFIPNLDNLERHLQSLS